MEFYNPKKENQFVECNEKKTVSQKNKLNKFFEGDKNEWSSKINKDYVDNNAVTERVNKASLTFEKRNGEKEMSPNSCEVKREMYTEESDENSELDLGFANKMPENKNVINRKKKIIPLSEENLIIDYCNVKLHNNEKYRNIFIPFYYHLSKNVTLKNRKHSNKVNKNLQNSFFSNVSLKIQQSDLEKMSNKLTVQTLFKIAKYFSMNFKRFVSEQPQEIKCIYKLRNRCLVDIILVFIYCGLGALIFRFIEGAFENFYKCGVKRVKREFLDDLWKNTYNMREDEWKSMARRKLMEFEEQLHAAHEAGVHSYSGKKNWTFFNSMLYCLTVITQIGYGHIAPITTTGRAVTIIYAIFGIPMFLIILADFGKLFTRAIKFLWAFIRRLYFTGSCRKVRKTGPVQEVMKSVQLVYDLATFRRPSNINSDDETVQNQCLQAQSIQDLNEGFTFHQESAPISDTPVTPTISSFEIDDEFNLPISVAISILLGYIFIGATLYHFLEDNWSFFESFYFVFISMSTIGFGDYVPTHPIYMMCSIIYLVFGLALTSMCINVVQVMLSDHFKQASQKLGATMGLEVTSDGGQMQPILIQPVDMKDTCVREENLNYDCSNEKEKM